MTQVRVNQQSVTVYVGPGGPPGPGATGGVVDTVTAGNSTITIGGTSANPTVAVTAGTYDASGAAATAQANAEAYALTVPQETGTRYVSASGNDSNDGKTWLTAKATIQAAINALPASPDASATGRTGVVEIGAGTFTVTSSHTTVTASCSSGGTTITGHTFTAADVGSLVVQSSAAPAYTSNGVNIPTYQIMSVSSGVATVAGNNGGTPGFAANVSSGSFTIIRPGVYQPAGVTVRGRGKAAATGYAGGGNQNWINMYSPTLVQDSGTDVAWAFQSGFGEGGSAPTAVGCELTDLSIWGPGGSGTGTPGTGAGSGGNGGNTIGLWTNFTWDMHVQRVDLSQHGVWGCVLQGNGIAQSHFEDCAFTYNGTYSDSQPSGGMFQTNGAAIGEYEKLNFINNYGCDVRNVAGKFIECTTAQVVLKPNWTANGNAPGNGNGIPFYFSLPQYDQVMSFDCCWFEGGSYCQMWLAGGGVVYDVDHCQFQGNNTLNFAIEDRAQVNLSGCLFQNFINGAIEFGFSSTYTLWWENSTTLNVNSAWLSSGNNLSSTYAPFSGWANGGGSYCIINGAGILATGAIVKGAAALAYSASITPNAQTANWLTITATNGTAFTINAPTNAPSSTNTQDLTIEVLNSSGGSLGTITWNGAFVFAGLTWSNPANTKRRFARFAWNGSEWVATSLASADY